MTSLGSIPNYESISAFSMSAPDSDSYFFQNAPNSIFCPECGSYLGLPYLPENLSVRPEFRDFGYTYDGRLIVSERAKAFLTSHVSTELSFSCVNQHCSLFVLEVTSLAIFDSDSRKTRFVNKCNTCHRFESVVGATPAFLADSDMIEDSGLYRTDLEFGSGKEKSPLLVAGSELKRLLQSEFDELDFQAVRNS